MEITWKEYSVGGTVIIAAFILTSMLVGDGIYECSNETPIVILNDTGSKSWCLAGWEFVDECGEHTGQWVCTSSTPDRYKWCYNVTNSSTGRENYYCHIGEVIATIPENITEPIEVDSEPRIEEIIIGNDLINSTICYEQYHSCEFIFNNESIEHCYLDFDFIKNKDDLEIEEWVTDCYNNKLSEKESYINYDFEEIYAKVATLNS